MSARTKSILLIHGLWMTPRSWELFQGLFEERGHKVLAQPWPRLQGEVEDIRRDPTPLNGLGIAEIANHYDKFVRSLDEPPIIMGHSLGGLIVQLLLNRGLGAAGVSIDGVAPRGVLQVPLSALRAASPVLRNPFNYSRTVPLNFEQFCYGFANVMPEAEARAAYERYAVPAPGRAVFQVALQNLDPWSPTRVNYRNANRAPLLIIAGSDDHQVPASLNRATFEKHKRSSRVTEFREFPGRSHLIMAQQGWQEVAEFALSWAEANASDGTSRAAS